MRHGGETGIIGEVDVEDQGQRERRRERIAALLSTRMGMVAMLIAVVLVTQAGLVYVAVDQIDTSRSESLIQPARRVSDARPPISVDAENGEDGRVPTPSANRSPAEASSDEAEPQGPPSETGLERARERAEPEGIAPPLTGNTPPAQEARPSSPPATQAADPHPGRSEAPASASASETGATASETPAETAPEGEDHPGQGPDGDGPQGQGGPPDDGGDRGNAGVRGDG